MTKEITSLKNELVNLKEENKKLKGLLQSKSISQKDKDIQNEIEILKKQTKLNTEKLIFEESKLE